jgi:hypothetical protein
MHIHVEPQTGHDLDRLITALLNATGVVHRMIESTEHPPEMDDVDVIGSIADGLRDTLAVLGEHRSDDELALVTQVLAQTTMLVATELGLGGLFAPGPAPRPDSG